MHYFALLRKPEIGQLIERKIDINGIEVAMGDHIPVTERVGA